MQQFSCKHYSLVFYNSVSTIPDVLYSVQSIHATSIFYPPAHGGSPRGYIKYLEEEDDPRRYCCPHHHHRISAHTFVMQQIQSQDVCQGSSTKYSFYYCTECNVFVVISFWVFITVYCVQTESTIRHIFCLVFTYLHSFLLIFLVFTYLLGFYLFALFVLCHYLRCGSLHTSLVALLGESLQFLGMLCLAL